MNSADCNCSNKPVFKGLQIDAVEMQTTFGLTGKCQQCLGLYRTFAGCTGFTKTENRTHVPSKS